MIYRLNTRYREKERPLITTLVIGGAVFCSAVIFGVFSAPIQGFLSPVSHLFLTPVALTRAFIGDMVGAVALPFSDVSALRKQNDEFMKEHEKYVVLSLERDVLLHENIALKASLGRSVSEVLIHGVVIMAPDASPYDTLLIDIGRDHGIRPGEKVLRGESLVGRIAEVYGKTSLVKLLSSPGEEYDVRIGTPGILGRAIGLGGGNFEVTLPRSLSIQEGDPVIIPSINPHVFGVVGAVGLGSSETFERILFSNPFNMHEIVSVDVIIE